MGSQVRWASASMWCHAMDETTRGGQGTL
jgi:hypothetical protein